MANRARAWTIALNGSKQKLTFNISIYIYIFCMLHVYTTKFS